MELGRDPKTEQSPFAAAIKIITCQMIAGIHSTQTQLQLLTIGNSSAKQLEISERLPSAIRDETQRCRRLRRSTPAHAPHRHHHHPQRRHQYQTPEDHLIRSCLRDSKYSLHRIKDSKNIQNFNLQLALS